MKNLLVFFVLLLVLSAGAYAQPYYLAGDFQGWSNNTTPMYDDGTNGDVTSGDGIYSRLFTVATAGYHGWKVTNGTWDGTIPASNAWFETSTSDQPVLFTLNTNEMNDEWLPNKNIVTTNMPMPTSLVAVGDWQSEAGETGDWNNSSSLTVMNDNGINGDLTAGDGIFSYHTNALPAGTWNGKAVHSGTWHAWGADGTGEDAQNVTFTTTTANQPVYIHVNINTNRIRVTLDAAVPVELSSFTAVSAGDRVILKWRTASEINNSGFEIERSSETSWEKIGYVEGAGNSTSITDYSFTDSKPVSGTVTYRLKQIDFDGMFKYSDAVEVSLGSPKDFALLQNYPNPFNPSTMISYQLPSAGWVTLKVFDVLGNEVAVLVNEAKDAGTHELNFNASNLTSGIYLYQISSSEFTATKTMMLIK